MLSDVVAGDEAAVVQVAVAGLRFVAVVLGAYLVASTVASLAVHGLRLGALPDVVDAVTLPPVRRLVRAVVGVGMGVAAGTLTGLAAAASADPPVPVMRRLGDDAPPAARAAQVDPEPKADAEPEPEPDAEPEPEPHRGPDLDPEPEADPGQPARDAVPAAEWAVRAGDHFWRIAEDVLAAQWQRAPTDREIDPYWRRVIAVNRDRLADHDNPDLLFPGQVLLLPPTPAPAPTVAPAPAGT